MWKQVIDIFNRIIHVTYCPVGRTPPKSVLDITLKNVMVKFQ